MLILGLNAYHGDSAACLIVDGNLVAAAEEERFRRIKHWAGFPLEAIRYCLREGNINLKDVQYVAVNSDSTTNRIEKIKYVLKQRPDLKMLLDRYLNKRRRWNIAKELQSSLDEPFHGKVHPVEHHLAHLASAHWASPFEESAVVSIDGFGDFSSGAFGFGDESEIKIMGRMLFPNSLGIFYQALTQFLGFTNYGDEYKVMGLAPYGKPKFLTEIRQLVQLKPEGRYELNLKYFRHHRERIAFEWEEGCPVFNDLFEVDPLEKLLGVKRRFKDDPLEAVHQDLAHSLQVIYEEAFFHLLEPDYLCTGQKSLSLSGGCAMNSVANGKIRKNSFFNELYVQSAAGDAGGAVGAAFVVARRLGIQRDFLKMPHAYWGPEFTATEIAKILEDRKQEILDSECKLELMTNEQTLSLKSAQAIADGKVLGWFQGRMEWGPRALGNRSIICDPRRSDMKGILNLKIKRRESFRPFAPSVLEEYAKEWFEDADDVPFMMKVYPIRSEKREQIPAVTHVDGSGRLQTVSQQTNPRYHRLISDFFHLTGVPMVLNTSFNENEPVVCLPKEALDCFLRTKMDVLVIGNHMILRPNG